MGKRSNFERVHKDYYPTFDPRAGKTLAQISPKNIKYAEPCWGKGHLEENLKRTGRFECFYRNDIELGKNALTLDKDDLEGVDYIITNPPWSRHILHPMIEHFSHLKPTWLLFDSAWAYTKQSTELMRKYCTQILPVGRLKWIENTKMSGKDDCSWYRFSDDKDGPIIFNK